MIIQKGYVMGYEELLEYLDITEPGEFQYFENAADIIECEEEISEEALERLFAGVNSETLTEIIENYFAELTDKVPQKAVDIYTLLDTIGRALAGLAGSLGNDEGEGANVSLFAEEINKFRKWYMFDTNVECRNIGTGEVISVSVAEAISLYRLENLDGDEYDYDFESSLDYQIEEYVMSFASLASASYDETETMEHSHEHHEHYHDHKIYDDSILDEGYVYDDEFSDEY